MGIDETGARRLVAAILHQAYKDYTEDKSCNESCRYYEECKDKFSDKNACEAKEFIHSMWCATLCDELDIDHNEYIKTCIKNHRLSKNIYRYIENEIKSYPETKKDLEHRKDDIILKVPVIQEIRGTDIGDVTANKALKISSDKQIKRMEQIIKGIETVYNGLGGDKKMVMSNLWTSKYQDKGMASEVSVDERTIRRWRTEIIYTLAIELKYL